MDKHKITTSMDMINSENAQIKEQKKKTKDGIPMKKKSKKNDGDHHVDDKKKQPKILKTNWKTRIFIKFQNPQYHYSYYETEDDMYNDRRATHELFIRNFDVLSKECHKALTDTLLGFGDLVRDIQIYLDAYDDPYCIVIFKYLNDCIVVILMFILMEKD